MDGHPRQDPAYRLADESPAAQLTAGLSRSPAARGLPGAYARSVRSTAEELTANLGLEPHSEGGWFRETYRAAQTVQTPRGERAAVTAILFLVTAGSMSRLHRLASDELWVHQGGLPLELVTLSPRGELETRVLGDRLPQALVPAGRWQGARLAGGPHVPVSRAWALATCVVAPGFDYGDFELGVRESLLSTFPRHAPVIATFT